MAETDRLAFLDVGLLTFSAVPSDARGPTSIEENESTRHCVMCCTSLGFSAGLRPLGARQGQYTVLVQFLDSAFQQWATQGSISKSLFPLMIFGIVYLGDLVGACGG